MAAVERTIERVAGPVIFVGHAYAGGVMAGTRSDRVGALVYVAALAPDEGETVADAFYRTAPHPNAPKLTPDANGLIWLPEEAFAAALAPNATPEEQAVLSAVQQPIAVPCISTRIGFIQVNDRLETSAPEVWAIGECAGSPQFTHVSVDDFRIGSFATIWPAVTAARRIG